METLAFLTALTGVLLVGIFCSIIARRLNLPDTLLLLIGGIVLGGLYYKGMQLVSFSTEFMTGAAIIALLMIVFDSAAEFKLKEINTFSGEAVKIAIVFLLMNLVFLTALTKLAFGINIYLCTIFAVLMAATSSDAVLSQLKDVKQRGLEILKLESIINTPLTVLLPFVILDLMKSSIGIDMMSKFLEEAAPFLQQFITGIGAGVIIGVIIFKLMAKHFSRVYSPLGVVVAALLSYVLAENLGGNGVLSVAVFGAVFANTDIKEKFKLLEFESLLTTFLNIIVFVVIGLAIKIPLTPAFIIKSLFLFALYLLIRYSAVYLAFRKTDYSAAEKGFMSLNMPKGIAVAVVAFTLTSYAFQGPNFMAGMKEMLDLVLLFMLYSIFLSSLVVKCSGDFLQRTKTEQIRSATRKKNKEAERMMVKGKKTI